MVEVNFIGAEIKTTCDCGRLKDNKNKEYCQMCIENIRKRKREEYIEKILNGN